MKLCTICKSELQNEKIHFRSKSYNDMGNPEADIVIFEAWCTNCEIYLTKKTQGSKNGIWETSTVKQNEIGDELSNEALKNLKSSIENLDTKNDTNYLVNNLWTTFISMKKDGDKIYTYKKSNEKGLVIVRKNFRIGKFPDVLNLFEQFLR